MRRLICWLLGHRHWAPGMERTAIFYSCHRCGQLVAGKRFHDAVKLRKASENKTVKLSDFIDE